MVSHIRLCSAGIHRTAFHCQSGFVRSDALIYIPSLCVNPRYSCASALSLWVKARRANRCALGVLFPGCFQGDNAVFFREGGGGSLGRCVPLCLRVSGLMSVVISLQQVCGAAERASGPARGGSLGRGPAAAPGPAALPGGRAEAVPPSRRPCGLCPRLGGSRRDGILPSPVPSLCRMGGRAAPQDTAERGGSSAGAAASPAGSGGAGAAGRWRC